MAIKSTRKSPEQLDLEAKVRKERKRVLQAVRRIKKRGYTVPDNIVPPALPKKITESTLRRYQKITTKYIYSKSVYTSPEGVTIKGTDRKKQEQSETAKKSAETKRRKYYESNKYESDYQEPPEPSDQPTDEAYLLYWAIYRDFDSWQPAAYWSEALKAYKQHDRDRGFGILKGAVNDLGIDKVASNMKKSELRILVLEQKILYESGNEYMEDKRSGEIDLALVEFNALLRGKSLTIRESTRLTEQSD